MRVMTRQVNPKIFIKNTLSGVLCTVYVSMGVCVWAENVGCVSISV